MTFTFSSGRKPVTTSRTDGRSRNLSANIRVLAAARETLSSTLTPDGAYALNPETLTITPSPEDNVGSIYSTAARILGAGKYNITKTTAKRANAVPRYNISLV